MVVSLAAYVYATVNNDRELDTNYMIGLAIADIFIAAALIPDIPIRL
jgi:hypothetical protein